MAQNYSLYLHIKFHEKRFQHAHITIYCGTLSLSVYILNQNKNIDSTNLILHIYSLALSGIRQ